jgi:hypothetical protein
MYQPSLLSIPHLLCDAVTTPPKAIFAPEPTCNSAEVPVKILELLPGHGGAGFGIASTLRGIYSSIATVTEIIKNNTLICVCT